MKSVYWFYWGVAFLGLAFFIFNVLKFRAKKKLVGEVSCTWSSRFNFGIPFNRIHWMIIGLYIAATIYFFLTDPKARSNYHLILFFILFLSYSPRWNVLVGSKGILIGLNFIPWEKMTGKKLKEEKKVIQLEFMYSPESDPSKTMVKRIQIPSGKCRNIRAFLKLN